MEQTRSIPLQRTMVGSARKIKYAGFAKLPVSFLRFGPVYYDATASDSLEMAEEEAWKHILDNSPNGGNDHDKKIEDIYLDAFRWVENGARACYEDSVLERLSESQFQWMMIKDGCFFLQLVLFILGASKELGYPNDHVTFGIKKKLGRKVVQGWIKSMFHAGNQIPLPVLNEFMKQDFFQDVVKKHGKWERPTDLLSKKVLYDLLVLPAILYANNNNNRHSSVSEEQPSDILHGLQNLVLGPKISRNDSDEEDDDDSDEEEDDDDEEGRDLEHGATSNNDRGNAGNDSEELCVSGLRRKGIYFWKSNNGAGNGIRGIRFKNRILFPGLYLPRIQLNQETELLFRNLKYYEMCQQGGQDEVRSFLGLMNKLISTREDIKHLSSKGILEISKPQYGEKFIRMLQNLSETVTDRNHRHVLQQLRDYSFSFRCLKFKKVKTIMLIATVASTVVGILSLRQSRA